MKTKPIFKSVQGREAILAVYDRILQRWPVPYQTQMISTRLGETFALTCGDEKAPPLVLLHGSGSNSAMWIGDAATYCQAYHVIAVDVPGEAGRSEPIRSDLAGPTYKDWLRDVLGALNGEQVSLLGISLGGWVALKFATQFPDRVENLVLLCPGGIVPVKVTYMLKAIPLSLLGGRGYRQVISQLNAGKPLPEETIDYMHLINTYFNMRLDRLPLFSDEELRRLAMPVLLLAGEKDPLMDAAKICARLEQLVPCLKAEILPATGHVLVNTAPLVMPFLQNPVMIRS